MIEAANIDEAMVKLQHQLETGSLAPGLEKCHDLLRDQTQENFNRGASPLGTWPPHAPATIRRHGPHPLLILTGELEASATQKGAAGHIETTGDREATFGTSNWKAGIHQNGAPSKNIPPRPFMVAGDEALDECAERLADAALDMLTEAI